MIKRQASAAEMASISSASLRRYLAAWGWQVSLPKAPIESQSQSPVARAMLRGRREGPRSFDVYMRTDASDGVELIVPRVSDSAEATALIIRAIKILAEIRDIELSEIVSEVLAVGYDVILSTIPTHHTYQESIAFERARGFVNGMREVLAATATTELEPRPFFSRLKREGTEYADQCRFGHTFHGSFGFTLESPVLAPAQGQLAGIEPSAPFERRVVTRFARGLRAIQEATSTENPSIIVEASRVAFGANACENFADMVEQTSEEMTFAVAFNPEWHLNGRSKLSESLVVGPRHVEVTRAAARELREQLKPWLETVVGRVVQLANHDDPSDLFGRSGEREVVIQWNSGELGMLHVRASLEPKDYLDAIDAHASGKIVSVSGLLDRRGRRWMLFNVTAFAVLL